MFELPVQNIRFFTPTIFELALDRRGYSFVPGESAVLSGDGVDARPYSIASAPADSMLRFLLRRIDGGGVSMWLSARRPGDGVRISVPFGGFRPATANTGPVVFVATGVGIAPFLSVLRARALAGGGGGAQPRPICLYGVRTAAEAVELPLLRSTAHLRVAVSRESVAGCHHGRVTDLLADLPLPDAAFYLCGLDAMVDAVATWLDDHGVDPSRVHGEVFFSNDERR